MKHSYAVLTAALLACATPYAQSAVEVYGSIDAGLRNQTNVNAAGDSKTTMSSNGTYNSNRLGFKSTEDLGNGWNTHFTLESGFNSGTGALNNPVGRLFLRTASVGVGHKLGMLDLGHQYTNAFMTMYGYDPLSFQYSSINPIMPATAGVWFDNDIKVIGTFGPVYTLAEWSLGEQAGSTAAGSARSLAMIYNDGHVSAGAAYTDRRSLSNPKTTHWTAGGAYRFGKARVSAGFVDETANVLAAGGDTHNRHAWAGVNYALYPSIELTAAAYRQKLSGVLANGNTADGSRNLYLLSATYAYSKRTKFYAMVDQARMSNALLAYGHDRQRDLAFGINHLF
ncbi:porin [Noviherbaspirillum pedocola]|uniref:Porin n=1 Tax=Noviherbaspirillum pedocola TaxID=2801341 RepID=A0A934W8R5_9BURK|nr:porin [Noviherbaspirillum pedocola]MBK4737890.1 porin [Noviherbaspirillum pedocola]